MKEELRAQGMNPDKVDNILEEDRDEDLLFN